VNVQAVDPNDPAELARRFAELKERCAAEQTGLEGLKKLAGFYAKVVPFFGRRFGACSFVVLS
jgi:hypothetical protein